MARCEREKSPADGCLQSWLLAAGQECDIELLWGTRCSSEISVSAGAYKSNVQCREMEYHDFIFMPSRRRALPLDS